MSYCPIEAFFVRLREEDKLVDGYKYIDNTIVKNKGFKEVTYRCYNDTIIVAQWENRYLHFVVINMDTSNILREKEMLNIYPSFENSNNAKYHYICIANITKKCFEINNVDFYKSNKLPEELRCDHTKGYNHFSTMWNVFKKRCK